LTILVYAHPASLDHDNGPGHPEAPVRIQAIEKALESEPVPGLEWRQPERASIEQLIRCHPRPYVSRILDGAPADGYRRLDGDTSMSPGSAEAVLRAAGAAAAAVDAVVHGQAKRAFVAMRPPGHHAEPDRAMGFCLFNNVALGAMQAREAHGLGKIAILDFDVHHGNGTQAIFWDDPETLYLSIHQSPLYPGTGARSETGTRNNIMNRPLPPGAGSDMFRQVAEHEILPRIDAFAPKLILVSAGFDAHADDPLAQLELTESDFAWITERVVELADRHAESRVVSVLEGGYNPRALAASVVAHLRALGRGAD